MVECYLIQHFVVPKANSHIGLNMVLTNVDTTSVSNKISLYSLQVRRHNTGLVEMSDPDRDHRV